MERLLQHKQTAQQVAQAVTNIGSGATVATVPLLVEVKTYLELGMMFAGFVLVCLQIYFLIKKNSRK